MVRVLFPNFFMRLVYVNTKRTPVQAAFHVPPRMTKTEVREYLTKIYSIPVLKVNTVNVLGKYKRLYGKREVIAYRRRDVKIAYVDVATTAEQMPTMKAIGKLLQ